MATSGIAKLNEAFDYSTLQTDKRTLVQEKTIEIRDIGQRSIVEIGDRLNEVKTALPHGHFGVWLRAEFSEWSEASAQRFMRVAEMVRSNPANSRDLKAMSASALIELAQEKVDEPVRKALVDRAIRGEKITAAKVKEAVKVEVKRKADPRTIAPNPEQAEEVDDEPSAPEADVKPAAAAARAEVGASARVATEPAEPIDPIESYNAELTQAGEDAEAIARRLTVLGGFDKGRQASVAIADGTLNYEETIGALRDVKRACFESRISEKRGNRYVAEREAKAAAHVAKARAKGNAA